MDHTIVRLLKIIMGFYVNIVAMYFPVTICCQLHDAKSIKIVYRPLTASEEFEHVIGLVRRAPFFKSNRYKIAFPQHPTFIAIVRNPELLGKYDIHELQQLFIEQIYNIQDYDQAILDISQTKSFIIQAIAKLALLNDNWPFKLVDEYKILVTLYGPGGQYNSETDSIFMLPQSRLTTNFAQNVVHEIVHIGIEQNIVQKYHLTHWEKERLVDLICALYLNNVMPGYALQINGDERLDNFVDLEAIQYSLPSAIERYIALYPR